MEILICQFIATFCQSSFHFTFCCYINLKNYDKSFKHSKFASEQGGSRDATTILGVHYTMGFGVDKDYDKAFELFEHAARQESCEALHFLGTAYAKGYGIQKNYESAVICYKKAIALGDKTSINYLSALYFKKPALDKNKENADLFSKCTWAQIQKSVHFLGLHD